MSLRSHRVIVPALMVLAGCSPVASPTSSPAPTPSNAAGSAPPSSTAAPATPAPFTPAPSLNTGWLPVPEQADVRAAQSLDVVWTGTRFVAVGSPIDGKRAFLDSADGLTWHLQAWDGPTVHPMRLASGSRGVVAVGSDADGRATSWYSGDGLSWSAGTATFGEPSGDNTIEVTGVVETDTGWLAVGREDPFCQTNCGVEPVRALAWTSGDGLEWTRIPDQPSFRDAALRGVARAGTGFVGVGSAGPVAAAWTSGDGTTWVRATDDPVFHAALNADGDAMVWMASAAATAGIVVAVGMEVPTGGSAPPSVRAWWSEDGVTWVEAVGDRFAEGQAFAVAATPSGFLATGPSGATSCLGGVWESADGRTWVCSASSPEHVGIGPYAAAASSTVEIVVGLDTSEAEENGASPGGVWWRPR